MNEYKKTNIGENIKKVRKQKGWTQEKLSERLNRSVSYVAKIEGGYLGKSNDMIFELMNALEVDANTIFACDNTDSIDLMLAKLTPKRRAYLTEIFKEMIEKYPG